MRAYAIRRFLLIIPTLLIVSTLLFALIRFLPGDLISQIVATQPFTQSGAHTYDIASLRHTLGLDKPLLQQYFSWLGDFLRGRFGYSLWDHTTLLQNLRAKIPVTVELSLLSLIIGLAISIPLGIYSAIRQDTWLDYIGRTLAILAMAIPSFWLATLIVAFLPIVTHTTIVLAYTPLAVNPGRNLEQFLLPAFIMGLTSAGYTIRYTRTLMLEVLRQDYVRTAWAKGLKEQVVIMRHVVRNTMIPIVEIVGGMIPGLFGGAVIFEQIFDLPGMGRYFLDSLNKKDYLIISGWNFMFSIFVMIFIVLTDLAYAYVDPRIHYK